MQRYNRTTLFYDHSQSKKINAYLARYEESLPKELDTVEKLKLIHAQRALLNGSHFLTDNEKNSNLRSAIAACRDSATNVTQFLALLLTQIGPKLLVQTFPALGPLVFLAQVTPSLAKYSPKEISDAAKEITQSYSRLSMDRFTRFPGFLRTLTQPEALTRGIVQSNYYRGNINVTSQYPFEARLDAAVGLGCNQVNVSAIPEMHKCMDGKIDSIVAASFPLPANDLTKNWHDIGQVTLEGVKGQLSVFNHHPQVGQSRAYAELLLDCHNKATPCLDHVPVKLPEIVNDTTTNVTDLNVPVKDLHEHFKSANPISNNAMQTALLAATALFALGTAVYLASEEETPKKTHNYNLRPRNKRD